MFSWKRSISAILCAAVLAAGLSGCAGTGGKAKADPTTITVWNYYNGEQQKSFDALVQEFNETVGAEKGILVDARSYGGVSELNEKVLDAIYEKVGSEEVPDIFASYADTAYEANTLGKVADLSSYLTEEEQARYVSSYLDEGRFEEKGGFKIFPVAKSTEVLTMNKTEWDAFAAATGASEADLATWEGIVALSERYYQYTDGLTPDVPDDGKPFFGRDAFANYIIIGSYQLGSELFQVKDGTAAVHLDRDAMRRLWDHYYVPFVNGYFGAYGKFRSDDIRTGDLVACVGATSGASFFPTEVTGDDSVSHPIEVAVYQLPNFAGTEPVAVQQGAGMVVSKSSEVREKAAVEFLKWFTQPEQNVRFAVGSGYLPVTYKANDAALVEKAESQEGKKLSPVLKATLALGMEMTQDYSFYTTKAFENGTDARGVCERSMKERAAADRAAVEALMAGGMPRAEAVAQYATDAGFDDWFQSFSADLNAAVGG